MWTIDFETEKIIEGSGKTPKPVGVSIKYKNDKSEYLAWGHPIGNNCTMDNAKNRLKNIIDDRNSSLILCHNSKFDLRICLEHFNLPIPTPDRIVDTMIMAYLIDPREDSLALKDLALKYCGMPPTDQRVMYDWLIANVPESKKEPGAYISKAPGDMVGKYAESDTDMTYALYNTLLPQFNNDHINGAFKREMQVLPIVIDLERRGINISNDVHEVRSKLESKFNLIDLQLSAYSGGQKPGSKAMFEAFKKKGLINEDAIQYTDKGNPRYGKEFLHKIVKDKHLADMLAMRSKLQKFISTYVRPFSESAKIRNGKYYPYYNQTRSEDDYGTRTGRFSSNIQQLPKDSGTNFTLYAEDDFTIGEMPSVRSLIVPSSPGKTIIRRDFSGQELRIVAHYAEGAILRAYNDNPYLDPHAFVDELIQEKTGHHLSRTPVKMINFLKLYGGGPSMLAERLGIPVSQARLFFQAYDEALPEFKNLMKDIEKLARSGKKIRTWGGRSYSVEKPKNGRELYYKLGNVLIQGSAADMTKEAMVRYFYHPDRRGDLIMQVHDELIVEVDDHLVDEEMTRLRWAMDEIPGWDVPLRSDGKFGKNLGQMEAYDDFKS